MLAEIIRAGELLRGMEKNKGARGQLKGDAEARSSASQSAFGDLPSAVG